MTLQQAAQLALEVQNASNLSGVVASFAEIMKDVLWREANRACRGTDWVNRHPIAYMFSYKAMSLTGNEVLSDWDVYNVNEKQCELLAAGMEPEPIGVYDYRCRSCYRSEAACKQDPCPNMKADIAMGLQVVAPATGFGKDADAVGRPRAPLIVR